MAAQGYAASLAELVAKESATELWQQLRKKLGLVARRGIFFKDRAEDFKHKVDTLLPVIQAIKHSGVEFPERRQVELDRVSCFLEEGVEITTKLLAAKTWQNYRHNHRLVEQLEKLEKDIDRFIQNLPVHIMADVLQLMSDTKARFDEMERSNQRMERMVWDVRIGTGGLLAESVRERQEADDAWGSGDRVIVALENGKRIVREMLIRRDDQSVVGICGLGGSGKTTLGREVIKDPQVKDHFGGKILFLTVSQSPNIDVLRALIISFIMGYEGYASYEQFSQWSTMHHHHPNGLKRLIVLDDVWSLPALNELVFRIPGCKTLVISRINFREVISLKHDMDLLTEEEATALFCHAAFGQKAIPPCVNETLVKQVVSECERLPLALKVSGASLKERPEMYWMSAKASLSKGEPICDSHRSMLFERMAMSIDNLHPDVRECFLDLGAFPEDMKIPLDVLVNIWVETRGIDEEEAYTIVAELSNKNLVTLVQDARAGDSYSSYFEIAVTLHDVLRDLAIQTSNQGDINARKRLIMPRRERELPRDWERNSDRPFLSQIVSVHTEQMAEMDWQQMEFPKAEVLIINFSADDYFLPPFINNMANLRAVIVVNHSRTNAVLRNFSVFSSRDKLRSLWLEKIYVPQLTDTTIPFRNLRKICLILCKITNSLNPSTVDLPEIFPCLVDLTIDYCEDLFELPSGICMLQLKSLSITNCHNLQKLPADMHRLTRLEILRVYACPVLKSIPPSVCELTSLKYLDISQCVKLTQLPEGFPKLTSLENIDMRECPYVQYLPLSFGTMRALRNVICDEEVARVWKEVGKSMPSLTIKVAEKRFSLDWLDS